MTYSLIARCPRTGQLGIAVASYSIAIGMYCDGAARANTGVSMTLGNPLPRNNYLAMNLLAQGRTAAQCLRELAANDPDREYRNIAVIDREGQLAVRSGEALRAWSGHRAGAGFVASGDGLAGEKVLEAMAAAFERGADNGLDERLLSALEAGRDAGGISGQRGRLAERSAAMLVWGQRSYSDIDLRVDRHAAAVGELRRIYVDFKPSIAYYEQRARAPRNAIPAMEFADMLKKKQQGEVR